MAGNTRLLRALATAVPALVLVAGIAAFAVTRSNGGSRAATKAVPLDQESVRIAHLFVSTAVARENVDASYDFVTPTLRGGMTRAEWATGTIPVVPYPVDQATTQVRHVRSVPGTAVFDVVFTPKQGTTAKPAVFVLTERKVGADWLVDGWTSKSAIGASK